MADQNDIKEIKRLNYFTGQFLETQDFQDEQKYHIDMRRWLNRLLYSPGIVDGGFEVTKIGDKRIEVGAGSAIDGKGRELLIITPQENDISGFAANVSVYVALRYKESTLPEDNRTKENISGYIRITERPEIRFLSALPSGADVGIDIPIAKLQLDGSGNIIQSTIDTSVRQLANLMVRGGKVGIGTTDPKSPLSVKGGLAVGTTYAGTNAAPDNGLLVEGKVGIAATTPVANLDIGGKANTTDQVSLQLRSGNTATNYESNQITLGYSNTAQYRHAIKTRHHSGQRATNAIDFYVWNQGTDTADTIGSLHTMTLDGGNVGIGTTAPGAKLEVAVDAADAATKPLMVGKGTTNYLTMLNDGNVGIGTTAPKGFQIVLPEKGEKAPGPGVTISGGKTGNASIELRNNGSGTPYIDFAQDATTTDYHARIRLTDKDKLAIEGANVGIGTTAPEEKLEVRGNVKLDTDGSLYASGGVENLRILRGIVDKGKVFAGKGFSVCKVDTGLFDITFAQAFPSIPGASATLIYGYVNIGTATATNKGGDTRDNAVIVHLSANMMRVKTGDSGGNASDRSFSFIVIGPR